MKFALAIALLIPHAAHTSGLDVQLKDLRGSFYYIVGAKQKECIKLVFQEAKRLGRLTHCDPEDDHVLCKLKDGSKLVAFELKENCEASLKRGVDPTAKAD